MQAGRSIDEAFTLEYGTQGTSKHQGVFREAAGPGELLQMTRHKLNWRLVLNAKQANEGMGCRRREEKKHR